MSDKVSIVMPAYNAERTIGVAIESVVNQTYPNFELVIVDDASTDKTVEVVAGFRDERIKLVLQKTNCGEGATRDNAILHSSGEWVAVLDADDAWQNDRLERMLSLEPRVTGKFILVDNIMQCYEKNNEMIPWEPVWASDSKLMNQPVLTLGEYLMLPRFIVTPLFPREAIAKIALRHSGLKFSADSEFIIRLLKLADLQIKVCPESLYLYRLTPGSMSSMPNRYILARDMLSKLQLELDFDENETLAIDYRKALLDRQHEYMKLMIALRGKDYIRAISLCIQSPTRLIELIGRVPNTVRYRLRIFLNRGQGR